MKLTTRDPIKSHSFPTATFHSYQELKHGRVGSQVVKFGCINNKKKGNGQSLLAVSLCCEPVRCTDIIRHEPNLFAALFPAPDTNSHQISFSISQTATET
jgi:hypothetical protein